jgi:hypothetical protein
MGSFLITVSHNYNENVRYLNRYLLPGLPDFSWYNKPEREIIYQNGHNKYLMIMKYTKMAIHRIPNAHQLHQNVPFQGLPKYTTIGIFWYVNVPSGNSAYNPS